MRLLSKWTDWTFPVSVSRMSLKIWQFCVVVVVFFKKVKVSVLSAENNHNGENATEKTL